MEEKIEAKEVEQADAERVEMEKKRTDFTDKFKALSDEFGFDFYAVLEYTQFGIRPQIVVGPRPKVKVEE